MTREMFEKIMERLDVLDEKIEVYNNPRLAMSTKKTADVMADAILSGDPVKIKAAKEATKQHHKNDF